MPEIAKILVLTLFAVFKDGSLDADAYVVPKGYSCHDQANLIAAAWRMRDPTIDHVVYSCDYEPDPRDVKVPEQAQKGN